MFGYTHCYPHISRIQNRGASDIKRPESHIAKGRMHFPCVYLQMQAQQKNKKTTNQNKPNQDTDLLRFCFCISWQWSFPAHVLRVFWWMHFNSIVLILVLSPFWLHRYYKGFTFRLIGSTFRHVWFWLKIVVRLNIIVIACLWIHICNES